MGSSQSVTSSDSSIQERLKGAEIPARPATPCYSEELIRVRFGTGAGGFVHGFPSNGGVYMLYCSAMELDFLGLDRFETALPSADLDLAEEDSLCAKMRLLGAEWWPSLKVYNKAGRQDFLHSEQALGQYREEIVRFFGVAPQGGVWALEVGEEECSNRQLGRINNARDMEKCRQIEKFGGTFYAAPSECPFLDFKSPFPERAAVHVLLADSDASTQEVASSLMAALGFSQITTVRDGKEALDYLLAVAEDKTKTQRKPDIILASTELPMMDAFECARLLRTDFNYSKHYPHTPIVVMPHHTMLGDNNLQNKSAATGMSGCFPSDSKGATGTKACPIDSERSTQVLAFGAKRRGCPPRCQGDGGGILTGWTSRCPKRRGRRINYMLLGE